VDYIDCLNGQFVQNHKCRECPDKSKPDSSFLHNTSLEHTGCVAKDGYYEVRRSAGPGGYSTTYHECPHLAHRAGKTTCTSGDPNDKTGVICNAGYNPVGGDSRGAGANAECEKEPLVNLSTGWLVVTIGIAVVAFGLSMCKFFGWFKLEEDKTDALMIACTGAVAVCVILVAVGGL